MYRADTENRLTDTEGGEEERVGSMERVTLAYVKQMANGNLQYDSGNSNWGFLTT